VREPMDPDDHFSSCCDPVDDEIKKLTGDNRALRMILGDCMRELLKYQRTVSKHSNLEQWSRLEMLVQQIDDELKSE
jgi:hypothetical protein